MFERRFGVLIASSSFPNEPKLQDLRYPEHDVDGLNELLVSPNHGQFTQTFVLKNKLHHENLLKINQVLREADKSDLVLIYYSGHGKLNPAGKLHLTSTDTVINALEATSIPVSTIKDYVDISSSNKIVLILDCCFSGAAGEAFARSGVDDQLQLVSRGRGTYIMTASTGIQVAQEKESDQYGVFTKHVIKGIRSGEADLDSDGRITMVELYRYVHDRMLDEGFQEPMKWDLNVRGELIIASSGKTPREERQKKIRKMLYNLAADGILPDDILDKARHIIALEPDQLSEEDRAYDRLLDQLLKKRLEQVEFIRKWDKVRPEKRDIQSKRQVELKRKAEEERHRKEKEELMRKSEEEERKRNEAEGKRKTEDDQKHKEVKVEIKIDKSELGKIKPPKKSNALKFTVAAGVIVMLMAGIWWWYSQQQIKGVRQEMDILHTQALNLENTIAEFDKPEQIEDLYRQRDTLSHQVATFSEQATEVGLTTQLEELQNRLKQIQIQLANKEKELFTNRKGKIFVAAVPDNAIVKILNIDQRFQQGIELEPGKYHVKVSSEGYEPQDRWIELGAGEEKKIDFELKKITPKVARLHIETVPEDATVRILNVKPKFFQGMELEPGSYHVEVAAEGYETEKRWIDLLAGHEEPFKFGLEKIRTPESPDLSDRLLPGGSHLGSIPNPLLELKSILRDEVRGKKFKRYYLTVSNWDAFPEELFEPAPDLPPCGRNANASRTWVDIYSADDDRRLYGFCGFSSSQSLKDLWFAVEEGNTPPSSVYAVLKDRRSGTTYRSNIVKLDTDKSKLSSPSSIRIN